MRIDLGCGQHCRGDIGITSGHSVCEATLGVDPFVLPFGFEYNPKATIYNGSIEDYVPYMPEGAMVLMSHVIEHLHCPHSVLRAIKVSHPKILVVVTPNALKNNADWIDSGHIYSFTEASLKNLLSLFFKVQIKTIEDGRDLMAVATL